MASLLDCAMLTSSFGCTGAYAPRARRRAARWRGWRAPRWRSCCARCRRRPGRGRRGTARDARRRALRRRRARSPRPCRPASTPSSRVDQRRRLLDGHDAGHQLGPRRQPGEREVLDRARRLDAVQRLVRHVARTESVVFACASSTSVVVGTAGSSPRRGRASTSAAPARWPARHLAPLPAGPCRRHRARNVVRLAAPTSGRATPNAAGELVVGVADAAENAARASRRTRGWP